MVNKLRLELITRAITAVRNSDVRGAKAADEIGISRSALIHIRHLIKHGREDLIQRIEQGDLTIYTAIRRDGQQLNKGPVLKVPADESLTDFYWRASQEPGSNQTIARRHSIDPHTYKQLQEIVLLAARNDLQEEDRARCAEAVVLMERTRQVQAAYRKIESIANRVWQSHYSKKDAPEGHGIKQLKRALTVIEHTIDATEALWIPYLNSAQTEASLESISRSIESLTHLRQRIMGGSP